MKKTFLMFLTLILSLSISFGLSGCAKNDELIVWWPSGRVMEGIISQAVIDFQKENPDAKIKIEYKPVDAFSAYKYALNDDKTRPDVAIVDHVYVAALAKEGVIANLSSLGSDSIKDLYPDNIYGANRYSGSIYGLPFSANTVVLMYNKTILKDCGIEEAPLSLDELLADCKIISDKGYTAFAQPQNSFSVMEFMSYVSRSGGSVISDDYKTITLDNTGVTKAIDSWRAMSKYSSLSTYEEDKFYNGKIAFVEMGSWALKNVTGSMKRFDCGFSEMVTIDSSITNYSGLGLYSLCVAEKSRDKALAFKFAEFLSTNKTVQLSYNQENNLFPVTKEALSDTYYTENEALKVYASQLSKVTARPATPVWPDMEKAIQSLLYEVVRTEGDYSSIVQKYQKQVQEATDRVYK